jgi:hypothetical protein
MPNREQLDDPAYAFNVGNELARAIGVINEPLERPNAYAEEMDGINPRSLRDGGLVRYQLEEQTEDYSADRVTQVHATAGSLGIKEVEYPFVPNESYDVILVMEGARNATLDRGEFVADALRSGVHARKVLVVGSGRNFGRAERDAASDWAPDAKTGFDVADAAVRRLREEHEDLFGGRRNKITLEAFQLAKVGAETRDVVTEVILRSEGLNAQKGKLALATTALYVPFKNHKALAIAKPLGIDVDVFGTASRQSIIDKRTTATYLAEVATTLSAAAQHQSTLKS